MPGDGLDPAPAPAPSTTATRRAGPAPSRRLVWLFWLALAAAFSPVWIDLVHHWVLRPWARYGALFAVLFALTLRRTPGTPPSRTGYALVALGLLLEVVAVGGGVVRLGRVGLGLALVGGCRALGTAPLAVALLGLWIVPLPHRVATLASPYPETLWQAAVAGPLGAPGLALEPSDGGLTLVALLAGLGWYAALRAGRDAAAALRTAVRWAPFGLAAQALAVAGAALLAAAGLGEAAWRIPLHHAWIPTAAAGLLVVHRRSLRVPQLRERGARESREGAS